MKSVFQFSNPVLTNLEYGLNEEFVSAEKTEMQMDMHLMVQVTKKEESNEASVSLKVEIGAKDHKNPFYINAVENANFRWENEISEDKLELLLHQNAPSLLLSYLRPIVAQITSASPFDTYNIPFINFTQKN